MGGDLTSTRAFYHTMSLVLGLGTLSIPYTLKQLGFIGGLSILAFLAWLSAHTAKLLCRCIDYVPLGKGGVGAAWVLNSYPDIGEAAYGNKGRQFVNWILYVDLIASSALFLVFIANNMSDLYPNWFSHDGWIVITGITLLPTVWLKLQKLAFLSTIGSFIMLALVFTVLYTVWTAAPESLEENHYHMFNFELQAIGNMVFAFACHGTLLTIYREMQNPAESGKLFNQVYLTGYMLKFLVGVSGYYLFAQNTKDQVTLNLPIVWLKLLITISVSMKKWLTYALPLEPVAIAAVEYVEDLVIKEDASGKGPKRIFSAFARNIIIRSFLVFATIVLALGLPHFGLFQSLVGSLCAGFLVLLFPIAFYLRLFGDSLSRREYGLHVGLFVFSCMLVALATYYSLAEATDVFIQSTKTTQSAPLDPVLFTSQDLRGAPTQE